MAHIISEVFNSRAMMAFWYHFAILFEALFILTAVDAGTRACRFMVQDLVGVAVPQLANNRSWLGNLAGTTVAVAGWGFFVYQGWSIRSAASIPCGRCSASATRCWHRWR